MGTEKTRPIARKLLISKSCITHPGGGRCMGEGQHMENRKHLEEKKDIHTILRLLCCELRMHNIL